MMGVAIAGPTASGKSALALALAQKLGGTVINADSMQVYGDLRIVTARPSAEEEAQAPHALYGFVDAQDACSAARWAVAAKAAIEAAWAQGRIPVLVGGTGLYFRSLFAGLAPVPSVPDAVRALWRARGEAMAGPELHRMLSERDPVMAARLNVADRQRIVRALEVIDGTGRSLAAWQEEQTDPLISVDGWRRLVLTPDRAWLGERLAQRFAAMMRDGGVDEVRAIMARGLDPALPAMKAIGVHEIAMLLRGEISEAEAVALAVQATRRYAKRQDTWFRTQMDAGWERVAMPADMARLVASFD